MMHFPGIPNALAVSAAVFALLQGPTAQAAIDDEAWKSAQQHLPGLSREVVLAACQENTVMLYTLVLRDNSADVIERFKKLFPCISVKTFVGSGGALVQRFSSEFQAGNHLADVWMNSSPHVADDLAGKNLLLKWTPPTANLIPDPWKKEGYWYAIGLAHIGVAWNTEEVNPEQKAWLANLKTWDQLPTAPFGGATATVDIRAGGTTQLTYYFFEKQYGPDFLKKLAALKPAVFSGVNPMIDRLVTGEFPMAFAVTADTAAGNQLRNGAPLRWKFPEPGLAVPYFLSIAAKSPHPNAAKLFLAWSLSKDGQTAWVNSSGLAPASKNAKDERPYAMESWYRLPGSYYRPDWAEISSQFKEAVNRFTAAFRK